MTNAVCEGYEDVPELSYEQHRNPNGTLGGYVVNSTVSSSVHIDENCIVKNSTITDSVQILGRCDIENCTVRENVIIQDFVSLTGCQVMGRCTIKDRAYLVNCNVNDNAVIGAISSLRDCTIGENAQVFTTSLERPISNINILGSVKLIGDVEINVAGASLNQDQVFTGFYGSANMLSDPNFVVEGNDYFEVSLDENTIDEAYVVRLFS